AGQGIGGRAADPRGEGGAGAIDETAAGGALTERARVRRSRFAPVGRCGRETGTPQILPRPCHVPPFPRTTGRPCGILDLGPCGCRRERSRPMSPPPRCLLLVLAACLLLARPAHAEPRTDAHGDPPPPAAVARLGNVRSLHAGQVRSVAFFRDGKALVSAGDGPVIHVWDAATGRELRRLAGHESLVYCVALSADGKTLASSD